ncbi:hypothetical protein FB45DRAFT_1034579 [Roridomyces roridus]|uniref:Uncharacterized protein n=1 Tax=Roridomyces roridus TaxID=1738132 RepID=A0AAD7BCP1_9AGAR|nr:hypothetical protein FB45DRAFT_1034579 [Roridomyces roridus]
MAEFAPYLKRLHNTLEYLVAFLIWPSCILTTLTGIPTAEQDVAAWTKYYDAPLKKCAIAAMNFPEDPHAERTDFLRLQIWHSGDASLPISQCFNILTVGRQTVADIPSSPFATIARTPSAEVCRKGRTKLGDSFYGVVRIAVFAFLDPRDMPTGFTTQWKLFSINQGVARASRTHVDW